MGWANCSIAFTHYRAAWLSMNRIVTRAQLIVVATVMLVGCTNHRAQFDGLVPASATSISYATRTDGSSAVTFHVASPARSYDRIDDVREGLKAEGYGLCRKSAISKWEHQPASPRDKTLPGFWIVELYSSARYEKFFVLRVTARPSIDGRTWDQHFSIASQAVPAGRQDMSSIKEFCE